MKTEIKQLATFSMKRSGQHAIINWLLKSNEPSKHFNNLKHEHVNKLNTLCDRKKYKLIIYSFEDLHVTHLPPEPEIQSIIIIRDPRNWIASRAKSRLKEHMVPRWLNHARSNLYKIIFDKWFISKEYRKQICIDLNLEFSDKALNEVVDAGVSSFDKYEFHNKAQQMDVLNRWQEVKHLGTIKQVLNNRFVMEAWEILENKWRATRDSDPNLPD